VNDIQSVYYFRNIISTTIHILFFVSEVLVQDGTAFLSVTGMGGFCKALVCNKKFQSYFEFRMMG
jgi:hypothetical protein